MLRFTTLATLCFVTISPTSFGQLETPYDAHSSSEPEWVQLMYQDNADPGAVTTAFQAYYTANDLEKSKHTQYYKRWMRELNRTVSMRNQKLYLQNSAALRTNRGPNSQWQCIGPWDFDKEAASRSYAPGSAHVYTVEKSMSNGNVMYAGTATTGLFRSDDKGQNWYAVTNDLLLTSIRAIEIDFTDEDVIYFGGASALWKSTDGGVTCAIIGDATFNSVAHDINEIVSDPTSNSTLFLGSDQGLYRSTDGGANWTQIWSEVCQEIEFNPNNPSIVYAVKQFGNRTEFHKSTDGGLTFTPKPNGWPNPPAGDEQNRTEIAVTTADPNKVVALATGSANGGSGLYGIYISTDAGESWTFQCCGPQPAGVPDAATNPNLMAWADDGSDDGGQYYYDLALDVSPTDANRIHVAGVNQWISTDGGITFTCPTKWSEPDEPGYVHADIHDIRYYGNELWYACDGGIFYSENQGDSIVRMQYGIHGTDFWGFGAGFSNGDVMLGGTYHNGTLLKDGNVYNNDWLCTVGGDNVRGFVNFANDRKVYHDNGGSILPGDRNQPLQGFGVSQNPNATYITGASSELAWDPRSPNMVYSGVGTVLHRSFNGGGSFEQVYDFGEDVTSIEVAWSNPDVIYVATYKGWWDTKKVYRTDDAGVSWSDITPSSGVLGGDEWVPYDLAVSSADENILWLARTSQYGNTNLDGQQVFMTTNGGSSWTNISSSVLDGENPTNIVHQRGSNGGVYIGTRRAVYYYDNTLGDWQLFNNNLPVSTFSTNLVPYYGGQKLRNGTNRSVWEVDFYANSGPSAQIAADVFKVNCLNDTVHFYDHSAVDHGTASWNWTFTGGAPASSTMQNPVVVYPNAGFYDVTLTVTDQYGTSTQTYTQFIEHQQVTENAPVAEDFESGDFIPVSWSIQNPDQSYTWEEKSIAAGPDCTPTTVAFMNHFNYNNPTSEDYLITHYIDLTSASQPLLVFDYAYARWGDGYEDGFRVEISTDCGSSWDVLWDAFGDSLETITPQTDEWEPACEDWVQKTFDLAAYSNQSIMLRFVGVNGWGNNFYLDDINIADALSVEDELSDAGIHVYPNPNNGAFFLQSELDDMTLEIYASNGQLVFTESQIQRGKKFLSPNLPAGVYVLRLASEDKTSIRRLVVTK